jgi:hypothetical protein
MIWLDITRLALLATVIGYAAYKDHTTTHKFIHNGEPVECGEVSNKVWLYAPFGLALTLVAYSLMPEQLVFASLSFVATLFIVLVLFYIGGLGGADAKAFLTIALCMPITPFTRFNLFFMYPLNILLVSVLMAFFVGLIRKKKFVRFLPYVSVAMFLALLI